MSKKLESRAVFTSNSDEWATPMELFEELDREFHFNLDPCSTNENAKCELHYTIDDNGLEKSWGGYRAFVNPPYSDIGKWVEKCYREGCKDNTLVVLLIPSRTDTRYFHNFIYQRCEIRFVKGRLKFGDGKSSAPFPSMIAIFRGAYV